MCISGEIERTVGDEKTGGIYVNKIALVFLITVATTFGLLPATVVLGRLQLLIYIAIGALIVAIIKFRSFETSATEEPSLPEFMLGGIGAIGNAAFIGFGWLFVYWMVFGGLILFEFIANLLGFEINLNSQLIAYYVSLIPAIAGGIMTVSLSGDRLAQQLYPQTAGIKSAFYEIINYKRRKLIVKTIVILGISGFVTAVALFTGIFRTWWFSLLSLMFLFMVTNSLSRKGEKLPAMKSENAIKAVSKLLSVIGYKVVPSPRTGKSEIDPLLVSLDLFAQKKKHRLAIEVRTPGEKPSVSELPLMSKLSMADLLTATLALEKFFSEEEPEETSIKVNPMVVFIGTKADDNIRAFSKKESIQIIEIPDSKVVDQILGTEIPEELQKIANRYPGVSYNHEDFIDSENDLEVPGGEK